MLKKWLITVSIIAVILIVILAIIGTRFVDYNEIVRAKTEAQQMKATRDSLLAEVRWRDSIKVELQEQASMLFTETERLRDIVYDLEKARAAEQLAVRRLRTSDDLEKKLLETFPEIAESDMGVIEVYNEATGKTLQYLRVPLWFSQTFIIDHENALSYKEQKVTLDTIDLLNKEIITLKDSIYDLEKANRYAYQTGYDDAFTKYQALNEKYIDQLKKPRFSFELPHVGLMVGMAAGGVLLGSQLK